jgi:hypothetical protein
MQRCIRASASAMQRGRELLRGPFGGRRCLIRIELPVQLPKFWCSISYWVLFPLFLRDSTINDSASTKRITMVVITSYLLPATGSIHGLAIKAITDKKIPAQNTTKKFLATILSVHCQNCDSQTFPAAHPPRNTIPPPTTAPAGPPRIPPAYTPVNTPVNPADTAVPTALHLKLRAAFCV